MKQQHLIEEIQARLYRKCGVTSISNIDKKGILHIIVSEAIHLGYILNKISDNPDEFYLTVLEDLTRNWQRFSAPINTIAELGKINKGDQI